MKTLLSSKTVRWALHGATLLFTFSLGMWVNRPAPQAVIKPVPALSGRTPPAPAPSFVSSGVVDSVPQVDAARRLEPNASRSTPRRDGINGRWSQLIDHVAQLNTPQTIAALRKLDGAADDPETRMTRQLLVTRFAEQDPETALTYVDTLDGDEHVQQKMNAMSTWASRDGAAASAHFDAQVQAGLLSDEDARTAAVIANEWAHTNPQAAWQWASQLPEEARDQALRRVAGQLARDNPGAAVLAVSSLEAESRPAAMEALATEWAQTSPAKTASWVTSISDHDQQARAASGLVTSWMSSDPMAASTWVSRLYPGATRDAAVAAMVEAQSLRNDPQAATLWAASVQDATLREQLVAQAVKRWSYHDADAASAWMASRAR